MFTDVFLPALIVLFYLVALGCSLVSTYHAYHHSSEWRSWYFDMIAASFATVSLAVLEITLNLQDKLLL